LSKITVHTPKLENNILFTKVSASNDLEKFLRTKELFIEYDANIFADESILNIPLTATVLPLAWLSGSDVHVNTLDRTFKESMYKMQDEFAKLFLKAPFSTEIIARNLIDNEIEVVDQSKRTGLLFSGGVDSTYSLINNLNKKPRLVMHWGVDDFPYPERSDHWEKTIKIYSEFAKKENLDINIIKTNISQILDYRRINHQFHKELYKGSVRSGLQHSLILLPTAAPLSVSRFDRFIIAASSHSGKTAFDRSRRPRAATPVFDEKIVWANLKVNHDGYILRVQKVSSLIKDYQKENELTLRVCKNSRLIDDCLNDNWCEKCFRTISSLILAGIDPNKVGFKVDKTTFVQMKKFWKKRKSAGSGSSWRSIQTMIPNVIESDIYGSKAFFEWFRDFEFTSTEKNWFWTDLYMWLPYSLARLLDKFYVKIGINVHKNPIRRDLEPPLTQQKQVQDLIHQQTIPV
jgi:hypothetical protein